jgi:hypothetical protein
MDETKTAITLLPHSGNGTVEQFYHFLLSYLLPLEIYISQQEPSVLTLRDCGPMNPWLSLLNPATELVLRPAEDLFAERAADDRRQRAKVLPAALGSPDTTSVSSSTDR